jgi:hypothetical protein
LRFSGIFQADGLTALRAAGLPRLDLRAGEKLNGGSSR